MGGELGEVRAWAAGLGELHERFVHRFARSEPRESALAYMQGLIAPLERKNGWTLAEEAGHAAPDRMHRLLNRCDWDADEVLDDVRDYVVEHLGDPEAVLIVDDTGFLKKGVRSAGAVLRAVGTHVQERPDGWLITPGTVYRAEVQTRDDPRMAMASALIGIGGPGISLDHPACVAKTCPTFFDILTHLGLSSDRTTA
ncbi:transposase [Streptomyces microflavus]